MVDEGPASGYVLFSLNPIDPKTLSTISPKALDPKALHLKLYHITLPQPEHVIGQE